MDEISGRKRWVRGTSSLTARWARTGFVVAGFLAGFFVREIGDDSDGDVSTSVSVLSLVVTIAFVLVGGLVEYLTSKRVR